MNAKERSLKQPDPGIAKAASPATAPKLQPAFDIMVRKELPPFDSEQNYIDWMLKNTKQTEPYLKAKWIRFQEALRRKDITEDKVLQAVLMAPREYFCRSYNMKRAYDDAAMPIGHGQTISGPHMVSRMTQSLGLRPHHRVLEIGTGSGYQAAVLAELSNYVYTIEIVAELTSETDAIYDKLEKEYPQYKNVKRRNSDGYYGWEEYEPFDRIIVTCGIDHIPPPLLRQLSPGGIMVIPVGPPSGQTVMKVTKTLSADGSISLEREDIFHGRKVIFVPFTAGKGEVHSLEKDGKKEAP
jgi:protein-L-isoaspartate(D-aspartate) O-methyltransferase